MHSDWSRYMNFTNSLNFFFSMFFLQGYLLNTGIVKLNFRSCYLNQKTIFQTNLQMKFHQRGPL